MTEDERRLQISLRLKAARFLAGHQVGKRATAMSGETLASLDPLVDEGITRNRLEEIEQMTTSARRADLDAISKALALPDGWFAGLYPSERGKEINDPLGAVLLAIAAGAQVRRPTPAVAVARSRALGRQRRSAGDDA